MREDRQRTRKQPAESPFGSRVRTDVVTEVARGARLSDGLLFRYFAKRGALEALLEQAFDQLFERGTEPIVF